MYRKDQQQKIEAGLCLRCGAKITSEHLRCDACLALTRQLTKDRKQRLLAAGLCYKCGKNPLTTKSHCDDCYRLHLESSKRCRQRLKDAVFAAYGGYVCSCCDEDEPAFLSIDHVNNDGATHRKKVGLGRFYTWLKANNYPPGFQVLCMNCQWGKKMCGGICPHQKGSMCQDPLEFSVVEAVDVEDQLDHFDFNFKVKAFPQGRKSHKLHLLLNIVDLDEFQQMLHQAISRRDQRQLQELQAEREKLLTLGKCARSERQAVDKKIEILLQNQKTNV